MNEKETEYELIEPALRAAGWGEGDSRIRKGFPIDQGRLIGNGRRAKPLEADYVLEYRNQRIGVVEAKARDLGYTDGVTQAKDYAKRLQIRYTYSTNGLRIYQMDMETGLEGDVDKYPSPDELWAMCHPEKENEWVAKFHDVPFETRGGTFQPRYYIVNAVNNVLDAVAKGENRVLLTMATGTGKTATAFQIAWKLFETKWNIHEPGARRPRVLFLADRNILADQAFNSFSSFDDDALVRIRPDEIKKKGHVPTNGSVFFTIFQTFMSGPNETAYFGEYPEDFFDFIIIDECHRGGANDESSWRDIMEHFSPAAQLGLTATPKRDVNGDTYKYFGEPVYQYSLKEGINDGFLSPFRVQEISTTGDTYIFTEDDEVLSGEIEEGKLYTQDEQNKIIEIEAIERYRVETLMALINQSQKTLVFCESQLHAAAVRNLINQTVAKKNPDYCHRVTADEGSRGEKHLRDFQDNEKSIPTILTTSHKLSTGVDAPEVRNIVLMRKVNSMVEFKQIIGRGTRLFDGKDYFTVYDFYHKAHEHFADPEWDGEPLCRSCGQCECECEKTSPQPCPECGERPCVCEKPLPEPCDVCGNLPCVCDDGPKEMIRIRLSDGKTRELQHMVKTSFWSADGKPITSEQFIQNLFGALPQLFKSEDELRAIWGKPDTRKKLLAELEDQGYDKGQLEELRKLIKADHSDLFDVLTYVAYNAPAVVRSIRAERARVHFDSYDARQQEFLNFVLQQYVKDGVDELSEEKLSDLLVLKYKAIPDAKEQLGDIQSIRETFIGFQEYLYEKTG